MSNSNFYNVCGNFTFQRFTTNVPPPPPPPAYFIPPAQVWTQTPEHSDKDFIKHIESKIPLKQSNKENTKISISEVREHLRNIVLLLNDLKKSEETSKEQMDTLSDDEWSSHINKIEENKISINRSMSNINSPYLDVLRKLLAKRSAKRLCMKRARMESQKAKGDMIRESRERSRKIDENLQKIKDEINKAKQEEEAKVQADMVLKEVLRKKQDAKKCIVKLDALVKLRRARQNTAKGRGEAVSLADTQKFENNIEKLKSLWTQKLATYEKEEVTLRAQLKQDTEASSITVNETEKEVRANLAQWRQVLFGGTLPQVDFSGDIGRFVAVRAQWDQYISNEGSPLPIGWVLPSK